MAGRGGPCTECERFESCTNPAKETRGKSYIGCANNAPVAVGEVEDILTNAYLIDTRLEETGYVLLDMWLENDGKTLMVRFAPDPSL